MSPDLPDQLFTASQRETLENYLDIDLDHPVTTFEETEPAILADAQVIITSWGAPRIDAAVLDAAPRLRAVLHAAGSVRQIVDPICWERGVQVTSAAGVNALPVAEYTVAMILLSGKRVLRAHRAYLKTKQAKTRWLFEGGNYGTRVGLVGASRIGRRVIELLRPFDLEVWISDPTLDEADARELGAHLATLDELLSSCDVISLHAPLLPSTHHMLDARRLALIRDGASFINTARGRLVEHKALEIELVSGRIWAVLDTTDPFEPLPPDSALWNLPNVFVTPHVAGSLGNELHRFGAHVLDNVRHLLQNERLRDEIQAADIANQA